MKIEIINKLYTIDIHQWVKLFSINHEVKSIGKHRNMYALFQHVTQTCTTATTQKWRQKTVKHLWKGTMMQGNKLLTDIQSVVIWLKSQRQQIWISWWVVFVTLVTVVVWISNIFSPILQLEAISIFYYPELDIYCCITCCLPSSWFSLSVG